MKKLVLIIFSLLFFLLFGSSTSVNQAYAQQCTGTGTCSEQGSADICSGGPNDGEFCQGTSDCPLGTCVQVPAIVYTEPSNPCSFHPIYNTCVAGCPRAGFLYTGGCAAPIQPPPPAPPAVRYNCNPNGYTCYNAGSSGWYSSYSSCDNNCNADVTQPTQPDDDDDPVECTTCGCPGQPPCSCLDESNCGDPNAFDCCGGACVSNGSACCPSGDCCTSQGYYVPTNVWLRVVSQEGSTGTTAWKGTQSNDPIGNNNWTVQELDGNGYFQTYKPYKNQGNKVFDKTKNKIDSQMKVSVSTAPVGTYKYTNQCGDPVTTVIDGLPAHGIVWSNHFCAAGWAWESDAEGRPTKTQDSSGKLFYTDMTGSSSDLFPDPDRDGCSGLFRIPNDTPGIDRSYHESLIPMLKLADDNHWADLRYDEYWSAAYQAWEQYDQTNNLQSVITLTPPKNYNCANVRSWGKQAQDESVREYGLGLTSNTDGTCTARFDARKYDNLIIMELSKAAPYERCTVQLEDPYKNPNVLTSNLTIDKRSDFVAHVAGESSEPAAPNTEQINLWIANDTFTAFTAPDNFEPVFDNVRNRHYYKHNSAVSTQQCLTNSSATCSMSVGVGNGAFAQANLPQLPEDTYNVFCDAPEGVSKCSGNTACFMNGGGDACYNYNDCEVDTLTPRDHATLTVSCIPANCSTVSCNALPLDDGCGGSCPADPNYGAPPTPIIDAPTATAEPGYNASPNHYTASWHTNDTTLTDSFDVIHYPQGLYPNPDAALAGYPSDTTRINYTNQPSNGSTASYGLQIEVLPDQNWKMTMAVRARNSTCGAQNSPWAISNYDLIGNITGQILLDSNNNCSSTTPISNPYLTNTSNVVATPIGGMTGFTSGSTNIFTGADYKISNLPYSPIAWIQSYNYRRWRVQLNLDPTFSEQTYVCSACNRLVPTSIFTCLQTDKTVHGTANFYVQLKNLANDAWWQLWGGNAYGKQGLVSDVPDSCSEGVNCKRSIIGNMETDLNNIAGADIINSAGIPISTSTISNTGNYLTENAGNPNGQLTTINFAPVLENYSYFLGGVDIAIPATAANPSSIDTISTTVVNADQFKAAFPSRNVTQASGEIVAWVDNSLTVNLTAGTANWNVPAGQKWIVFVPGDLIFTGPTDRSAGTQPSTQQYLVEVETGGFLAFIAKGDITFNENLGYGYPDDTDMAQFTTPIVEGVYIASDTLIIKTNGDNTLGDYKFVGAGTFVGWTGVNLERDFDNGQTRKSLHNNSPTELFIYRPDFMVNTPGFMQKSAVDWREVN